MFFKIFLSLHLRYSTLVGPIMNVTQNYMYIFWIGHMIVKVYVWGLKMWWNITQPCLDVKFEIALAVVRIFLLQMVSPSHLKVMNWFQ
jgi:hypothetical protein